MPGALAVWLHSDQLKRRTPPPLPPHITLRRKTKNKNFDVVRVFVCRLLLFVGKTRRGGLLLLFLSFSSFLRFLFDSTGRFLIIPPFFARWVYHTDTGVLYRRSLHGTQVVCIIASTVLAGSRICSFPPFIASLLSTVSDFSFCLWCFINMWMKILRSQTSTHLFDIQCGNKRNNHRSTFFRFMPMILVLILVKGTEGFSSKQMIATSTTSMRRPLCLSSSSRFFLHYRHSYRDGRFLVSSQIRKTISEEQPSSSNNSNNNINTYCYCHQKQIHLDHVRRISSPSPRIPWRRTIVPTFMLLLVLLIQPSYAHATTKSLPNAVGIPFWLEFKFSLRLVYAALIGAVLGREQGPIDPSTKDARRGGWSPTAATGLISLAAAAFTGCASFGFLHLGAYYYNPSLIVAHVASAGAFLAVARFISSASQQSPMTLQYGWDGWVSASLTWISSAVGVACGIGMFVLATTTTLTTVALLRFLGHRASVPRSQTPTRTMATPTLLSSSDDGESSQIYGDTKLKGPRDDDNVDSHTLSLWEKDYPPHQVNDHVESDGQFGSTTSSLCDLTHPNRDWTVPTPSPISPVREKYQSKSAREDRYSLRDLKDPMTHPLVQHAWRQSNSTSYDDIRHMTWEELERFVERHKPSISFYGEKKTQEEDEDDDDDSPDHHHP